MQNDENQRPARLSLPAVHPPILTLARAVLEARAERNRTFVVLESEKKSVSFLKILSLCCRFKAPTWQRMAWMVQCVMS